MSIEPVSSPLHYRIVEKIGEGGTGVVRKGVETTLGREAAIKAPDPGARQTDASLSPTMTSAGSFAGMIPGTAACMSPEQAREQATAARADVWAFGVVLFGMLSGASITFSWTGKGALPSTGSPATAAGKPSCCPARPARAAGRHHRHGTAAIPPDGRWIARESDESSRDEIHVRPFPGSGWVAGFGRWRHPALPVAGRHPHLLPG